MKPNLTVAGVDVGGMAKGFHAVALRDGVYRDKFFSRDPGEIVAWCLETGAQVVGVDAPCRWSGTGRARLAEKELMQAGIWCFATPAFEVAQSHPKNHFDWMLNGANLYSKLEAHYRLFDGGTGAVKPQCIETFPHAVTCALAGKRIPVRRKGEVRREMLQKYGVDTTFLTNIDTVDAALCALAAHYVSLGRFKKYGDIAEGFIAVPSFP